MVVTLPVVVHIIHDGGPENISDAQVLTGIQQLNEAFANTGNYNQAGGANTMILVNEDFSSLEARPVGIKTPERGFSSFKFVPGSGDQVIVALKSDENADTGSQASYITVITLDGQTLLDETPIPGAYKYEGIEFI